MLSLSSLALVVIVIAWVIQFLYTTHKKHDLNPLFLILYILGAGIMTWDSYSGGSALQSLLNLASFIAPIAILMKISK